MLWIVIGMCCGAPVIWLMVALYDDWTHFAPALLNARSLEALSRTIFLNGLAAILACLIAVMPAIWIGSSRRPWLAITLVALPLLLPSAIVSYAWRESLNLLGWLPRVGSLRDELRCSFTLASWLWPLPALSMGLTLRRMDRALLWQARIDGAMFTIILQLLRPAILVGIIGAFVLASQEFSIYETTGILVASTAAREEFENFNYPQPVRFTRAVAALLPLIVITLGLALTALIAARRVGLVDDIAADRTRLHVPRIVRPIAWIIAGLATVGPVIALVVLHRRKLDLTEIINTLGLNLLASAEYATISAIMAFLIALAACVTRQRALTWLACTIFLIGGQLVAIVLIRFLNTDRVPLFIQLYHSPLIAIVSNLARFSWIALSAGLFTWQGSWRPLRDMSASEGASPAQTARHVILPMAMPIILASTLIVATLSFTEVGATILIQPSGSIVAPIYRLFGVEPSGSIIPIMMTWVHIQRFDELIEACLIVIAFVIALGTIASLIARRIRLDD